MKIYLSGPMQGIEDLNFDAFREATKQWTRAGHQVFNPCRLSFALGYRDEDEVTVKDLKHFMAVDIACIYAADAIALLPGWEESLGATVEVALAQFLRMPIYDGIKYNELSRGEPCPLCPWQYVLSSDLTKLADAELGARFLDYEKPDDKEDNTHAQEGE